MKNQPLVAVALLFMGGVALADSVPLDWRVLLAASGFVLLLACALTRYRQLLLAPLLILAGATALSVRTAAISQHDLRIIFGNKPEIVILRGTLTETPYQRVYERRQKESVRTIAFVSVDAVSYGNQTNVPAAGDVAISTTGILPDSFYAGQRVEINGVIDRPVGPPAEGLFDYRKYLGRLGIYYQAQASSTNDWRVLAPGSARPLADRFTDWAQSALALGLPNIDEPVRLLWAMSLGWKTGLSGDVSEPFMRSGTMHVFAISGLHIAFITLMIVGVLRCFAVPRSFCALVVIPLIWAYTGITGWQASAIRSTIMSTVIVAGWSLQRPSALLNSLAAAAFIILIWDPQQLFQPGFQLSFGVVLSLALMAPVLTRWKEQLLQPDPFLPDALRSRRERWTRAGVNVVLTGLTTSLAAWLGSIPVVAYYFHFLTPSSLIANLVVVPLSSLALLSNMATLAVAGWFPFAAELFNHAGWAFMSAMISVSQFCADMPGGCFNIQAPGLTIFFLYYAILISVMAGWFRIPRVRDWSGLAILALAAVWLLQWRNERSETRLSLLPLHGGEAIYIERPAAGLRLLVDGGDENAAGSSTKQFLRARGLNSLSALVLTHGDIRQNGGASLLQATFPAKSIYAGPLKFRSPAYRRAVEEFQTHGLLKILRRGDHLDHWLVLHPEEKDKFKQADDVPLVLLGNPEGVKVLLLSDLSQSGQNMLLARDPDLRADIVVSGIPKNSEPLVDSFLAVVQPRAVIICDALFPATEHASRSVRSRLAEKPFPVWYTSDSGGLTVHFKDGKWTIDSAFPAIAPQLKPVQSEKDEPVASLRNDESFDWDAYRPKGRKLQKRPVDIQL